MFKKFTSVVKEKRNELNERLALKEGNAYLDFSKKYHKEQGVSGPFDKKFKGDKKAQKEYMQGLSDAWEKHKEEKGLNKKKSDKKFDFKNKVNEGKALEMSLEMIKDGGDPNYHFVTMCDDYKFEHNGEMVKYSENMEAAPLKIKTTPDLGKYVFGPFLNLEESKLFASSIELDEINGPRMVTIEDRKEGKVYCKALTCKLQPVWDEHVDDMKPEAGEETSYGEEAEEYESPTGEYTYSNEDEE